SFLLSERTFVWVGRGSLSGVTTLVPSIPLAIRFFLGEGSEEFVGAPPHVLKRAFAVVLELPLDHLRVLILPEDRDVARGKVDQPRRCPGIGQLFGDALQNS